MRIRMPNVSRSAVATLIDLFVVAAVAAIGGGTAGLLVSLASCAC